jgi:hypothetical protein
MPKSVRSDTAVVGDKIVRGGTFVGRYKTDRKCISVRSDTAAVKDKAAWRWKSVRDDIAFVRNKAVSSCVVRNIAVRMEKLSGVTQPSLCRSVRVTQLS